jgi:MFS family permease
VCGLAIFIDVAGTGIVIPAIPEFASLFGASEAGMGLAFSMFAVAFLLSVLPLGAVVGRTGRIDLVVGAGMAFLALAAVSFALAPSIWVFSLGQAFHGVGSAATWVSAQPLAARLAAGGRRQGIWFSVITIAMGLGLVAGPLIGVVGGLRTPFVIYLVLACAAAVTAVVTLRGQGVGERSARTRYRTVLRNPRVLAACLVILVLYAGVGMLEVLFPLYMSTQGFEKSGIGVLFFWLAVFLAGSQPFTGRWIDRIGPVTPTVVSLVAIAVLLPLSAFGASFATWIPVFMILGVATGIPVSATMMLIAAGSRAGERGVAYALWNFSFSIGYLIGPALGGTLAQSARGWGEAAGLRFPFFVLAAATLAAAPVFARLARHRRLT